MKAFKFEGIVKFLSTHFAFKSYVHGIHRQKVQLAKTLHNISNSFVCKVCFFYFDNSITMAEIIHQNVTAMTTP